MRGEFYCNSNILNINKFNSDNSLIRTFDISNSTLNITGFDTTWRANSILFNFNQTNSTINFNYSGNNSVYFSSGGNIITYQNVIVNTKNMVLVDQTTFNNLTLLPNSGLSVTTLSISGLSNVININTLNAIGNCTSFITIKGIPSNNSSTQYNLNVSTANLNFCRIKNTSSSSAIIANNSIDLGNNTNITINEEPSNGLIYWINNGGNWSDPTHWSTGCIPGPNDIVVFNASSFSIGAQTVNVDINAYCASMHWTGVTNNPTLAGTNQQIVIKDSVIFDAGMVANYTGDYVFTGNNTTNIITTNNVQINGDFIINSLLGQWTYTDNFNSTANIVLNEGNIDGSNLNINAAAFLASSTNISSFDFTNSTVNLTGTDSTWVINPTNLTSILTNSSVLVNHSNPNLSIIDGGGLTYNKFSFLNPKSSLYGTNTFNLLYIAPNSSLGLESGITQNIDSLIAIGYCDSLIVLESTDEFGLPANINKTGFDTLIVDYINLSNVTANNSVPKYNSALNCNTFNNTTGWSVTPTGTSNDFYWVNGSGNWSDISHWENPLGTPSTCLPNITDTVHFNASSFNTLGQNVTVDIDAFFAKMEWSSEIWNPILSLNQNLICNDSIILNSTILINNNNPSAQIKFVPNNKNAVFKTFNRPIKTNIMHQGGILTDTLLLNGNLNLDTLYTLSVAKGTFNSNGDTITANALISTGSNNRKITLNNSYVELYNKLDFTGLINLESGISQIYLKSNVIQGVFNGNNLNFYDLTLENLILNGPVIDINNSNNFNDFKILPGSRIRMQGGMTQTVNGHFIANGTCIDSIYISSQSNGVQSNFSLSNLDTLDVVSIKDINISTNNLRTLSSSDKGNNLGITFDNTPSSVPNFTVAYDNCLGNTTTFTNASTSISGNINDINYLWDFGDGNSSTLTNPIYTYNSANQFYVTLTTTYINLCKETHLDSVRINHPIATLSSNDYDLTICDSTEVIFTAISSPAADNYNFYINGVSTQSGASNTLTTTTLSNNYMITLNVTLNGCSNQSNDTLNFIVNPLPNVILNSSDIDNEICYGEQVNFTTNGASTYEFYINNTSQNSPSINQTFTSTTLNQNDTVWVIGFNGECATTASQSYIMIVHTLPLTLTSNTNNLICQGESITYVSSGADSYEFFCRW